MFPFFKCPLFLYSVHCRVVPVSWKQFTGYLSGLNIVSVNSVCALNQLPLFKLWVGRFGLLILTTSRGALAPDCELHGQDESGPN